MLETKDVQVIRDIVHEVVHEIVDAAVKPIHIEINGIHGEINGIHGEINVLHSEVDDMNNRMLRMDGKIDALARVADRRFDEVLASFNAYATVTDRRLLKLETHLGLT